MSGLLGSIYSTTNALQSNQLAIEIAGKNMANVNNASYSRQRVEFGISGGISESTVSQVKDDIIDSKLVRESSVTGDLEAQNQILRQLQVILGEQITDDPNTVDTLAGSTTGDSQSAGMTAAINDFFNALQSLSTNPDDIPTKAAVIAQAEVLVTRFNTISSDLEDLEEDVVTNIETDLDKANTLFNQIAALNKEIGKIEIADPGGAHEFRDLRQQKLEELAQYVDFDVLEVSNGQIQIYMTDKDGGGNSVAMVDKTIVSNTLKYNDETNEVYFSSHTQLPLGDSPNDSAASLSGGSVHAYVDSLSMTDPHGGATSYAVGSVAKLQEDLDTLARELATQVSAIYDDTTDPAAPELFFDDDDNPDAIDLTAVTAGNIRLYQGDPLDTFGGGVIDPLNSTTLKGTNTDNAGANELAVEMAELADFVSDNLRGNSFSEFVSEVAADLGYELSNNNQLIENQELVTSQLQEQRASVSGVSIDEELANMVRYQRSFEASAKVLQIMDEMLSVIVNQLVR